MSNLRLMKERVKQSLFINLYPLQTCSDGVQSLDTLERVFSVEMGRGATEKGDE